MADRHSAFSGARIAARVKRYDAAKGYGFLAPGGGMPDIFCHVSALREVGLETLLEGATVTCETAEAERGPQVARIHAVDFSTADRARVGTRGDAGAGQAADSPSHDRIRAVVKWYVPTRGYGFLAPEDGTADVFCHAGVVEAAGYDTLPQGAAVTCDVVRGGRGRQVSRILAVDASEASGSGVEDAWPRGNAEGPEGNGWGSSGADVEVRGTVKFYDPGRGFGFVVPDGGGREVFVHMSVVSRSGLHGLQPGQRVSVRVEEARRGPQASELTPIY